MLADNGALSLAMAASGGWREPNKRRDGFFCCCCLLCVLLKRDLGSIVSEMRTVMLNFGAPKTNQGEKI